MKIIMKKYCSEDTPIELSVEPEKITIAELAQLYLNKLSRTYVYSIEKTQYTVRNHIISSDFSFILGDRTYSAKVNIACGFNGHRLLSEIIRESDIRNGCITMHSLIYATGKNGYPLNSHIRKTVPSLRNLCLFKIKDMKNEQFNHLIVQHKPIVRAINGTQKNIIEGTLSFIFGEIEERVNPTDETPPSMSHEEAIKALNAIISEIVPKDKIEEFKKLDIWEDIKQMREILSHPCPQNRSASYPYVGQEAGFCMFKMEKERVECIKETGNIHLKNGRIIPKNLIIRNIAEEACIIAKEPTGLLGLTGREDDVTLPVTKQAVVDIFRQLVNEEILTKYQEVIAKLDTGLRI